VVVEAARLHRARERKQTGLTLIEGPHLLEEAVDAAARIRRVFALANDSDSLEMTHRLGLEALPVDEAALKRLSGTETPRGPIAVVDIPESEEVDDQNLLVSWGVSDPGNVGTMIRIARAFGWAFGYAGGTSDPWSPKVLRSAAGNQFATPISRVADVASLRTRGFQTVATVVRGGGPPAAVDAACAVLIGEEAAGLPEEVVTACDHAVTIPMPGGAESLNAGMAAAIIVYHLGMVNGDPSAQV